MTMTMDRQDLDLSLLRTFLAVVRYGSTGRAATAVARSQPAVSQRISRLEKIVGRKLFSRSLSGVKLTGHGELLVEYANRAIALNEEALIRLRKESVSGPVRLGVSEESLLLALTPTLKRFQRTYPDVELKLSVAGRSELDYLIEKGELDFVFGEANQTDRPSVAENISRLAWFAGAEFSIDSFSPLPLVLFQSPHTPRERIVDSLRKSGWECRVVMESANLGATIAAVESGLGVSALFRDIVRDRGVREMRHARLPVLPSIHFELFQGNAASSRAKLLLGAALVASIKATNLRGLRQSAEIGVPRPMEFEAERMAIC